MRRIRSAHNRTDTLPVDAGVNQDLRSGGSFTGRTVDGSERSAGAAVIFIGGSRILTVNMQHLVIDDVLFPEFK